jgi:hypothetical protein
MSRYIDADKLLTDELTHTLPNGCGRSSGKVVVFADDIENAPTADVVEVVRCKDCVNYYQYEHFPFGVCDRKADVPIVVYPNHYCGCGERREENEG